MTFGGDLFTSNIDEKKVHRVLDVGTGTGIWAIDFGTYCKPISISWKLMTRVQRKSILKQRYCTFMRSSLTPVTGRELY
jgi:ubiquinone/menaquinone biosynthesis C-methylase UbiE